jgi:predicted metal-dependent peptidase
MSSELEYKIKPTLNNIYGKEPDPIVGSDKRVNIVLTPMLQNIQGYIKTGDFVSKKVFSASNEGNVIYLNASKIKSVPDNLMYSFLAHEFTHIITYNQKYLISGAHDDV